jgi:hypothetical protein
MFETVGVSSIAACTSLNEVEDYSELQKRFVCMRINLGVYETRFNIVQSECSMPSEFLLCNPPQPVKSLCAGLLQALGM